MTSEKFIDKYFYLINCLGLLGSLVAFIDGLVSAEFMVIIAVRIAGFILTAASIYFYRKGYFRRAVLLFLFVGIVLFTIDNFRFAESYMFLFSAVINSFNAVILMPKTTIKFKTFTIATLWLVAISAFGYHQVFEANYPELIIISPTAKLIFQFTFVGSITMFAVLKTSNDLMRTNEELETEKANLERTIALSKSYIHDLRQPLSSLSLLTEIERLSISKEIVSETYQRRAVAVRNTLNIVDEFDKSVESIGKREKGFLLSEIVTHITTNLYEDSDLIKPNTIQIIEDGYIPLSLADCYIFVRNLIGNSIKYQNEDRPLRIMCSWSERNQTLVFSDNGKGVQQQNIELLGKQSIRENQEIFGTGNGLLNLAKIAKLNNGSLGFQNNDKHGLRVSLSFN